jgi:hypothetical protein
MEVKVDGLADGIIEAAARILKRELSERGITAGITLRVNRSLVAESFCITRENQQIYITGGDANGVLYGCGRLIRQWPDVDFSGEVSVPGKPVRGMYFAVHMDNFYHVAPMDTVARYVEELALYGINTLTMYFHIFHFTGISDPECVAFIDRLNAIYAVARSVGMKTGVLVTGNDGYLSTPGDIAFEKEVPRNWGTEICPDKPGAMEQITRQFGEVFDVLSDMDYLIIWPYDSGGCHCRACYPWGVKGFYRVAEPVAKEFRKRFPCGKVVISTWMFDYNMGDTGEWDEFYKRLADGQLGYADMIMADGAHVNGYFPQRVIDSPLSLPVISFLEISMRVGAPWGSFGANPMPAFIETEWTRVKKTIVGGTPYSEGIFEDINKFIWAQLCWSPDRTVRSILEEYSSYVASADCASEITDAIFKIENVGRREPADLTENRITLLDASLCADAWRLMEKTDRKLPRAKRRAWRWRLLLLRARIDAELAQSGGAPTAALGRVYDELTEIYHITDNSLWYIHPYEVRYQDSQLRFVQPGRGIGDICKRFNSKQATQLLD